ncbi:MAG: hypothetical protein FJW35_16365, partial [Acidobacteria bacterium]|nr:hypothetical protein [Acidobacteriota bacterium]
MTAEARVGNLVFRVYLHAVTLSGMGAILYSVYRLEGETAGFQWLILASMTLATGTFTVKIPGVDSRISVADTFIFTNLILFGPSAGTLTAALD